MGKRTWIVAGVSLVFGLAAGSASTYLWLTPQPEVTSDQGTEAVIPPDPSEQEVQATFQSMLADAGVDAEVVGFRRVRWTHYTQYFGLDGHGGYKELAKPIMKGQYTVAYETELAFRGDCQVQESFELMWSPGNEFTDSQSWATGSATAVMSTQETRSFKKGERQQVRGTIDYTSHTGQWKLQPDCQIDAGR